MEAYNPFLPLDVYIADGEPHVFGDRVYLFGSHDKAESDTYCGEDYEIFSASIHDLSHWTSKGINYSSSQDPLSEKTGRKYMYAPDCVKGNDGKYYLYYSLSGEKGNGGYFGPISVARCDTPDGKYEYYGYVRNPDGSIFKKYVTFDPAIINDEGTIRLYYGTYYPFDGLPKGLARKIESGMFDYTKEEIKAQQDDVMGPIMVELAEDMLTVKSTPTRILPVHEKESPFATHLSVIPKSGHFLYGHGFFEGSSIRKINGLYYFIYSSMNNCELCYATSRYPDREFKYGGVIISTGDAGYQGRKEKDRVNFTATNHGSIENIDGQWYVFYHRQTHGSDYSRQACAEKIIIAEDGSIAQVPVTSCGLNQGDLSGKGTYPIGIYCQLTNGHMPHGNNAVHKGIPMLVEHQGEQYLTGLKKNTWVRFKYFDFMDDMVSLTVRGKGKISLCLDDKEVMTVSVDSLSWQEIPLTHLNQKHCVLGFKVLSGNMELKEFTLK